MIPLIKPLIPQPSKWLKYLKKSYKDSIFSNHGPCAILLENRLKNYLNIKNTPLLVCNATLGLEVVLRSLGLPKNAEVIIPSFTFAATAHSVINAGLKPVLVDCDFDLFLDLDKAQHNLTKKTKVMVVVQALGFSCDYKKYESFAKKNKLKIIFDSAACLGASYADGTKVGTAGDFEIFSLHATKTFGIGEGGLITSKNKKLLDKCRKQINFGFDNFESVMSGTNGKMSEFHAAVGNAVLDVIDFKLDKKHKISNWYSSLLENTPEVTLFPHISAFQVFPIFFYDKTSRDKVKKALEDNHIGARIYYKPLHTHKFFKDYTKDSYKRSDYFHARILCVPIFDNLSKKQVKLIVKIIKNNL